MLVRLERWATARLEALGVDGVFAPYVVGMLEGPGGGLGALADVEETKFNVHQVLMGWLSPEDEERAQEFVDDLVKYAANPALIPDARKLSARGSSSTGDDDALDDDLDIIVAAVERTRLADINDVMAQDVELKASAPTFVPGAIGRRKYVPPVVDDDTGEEDDDDSTDFSSVFTGSVADAFSNGSGFSLSRRGSLGSLNPNPKEFVPGAAVLAPPLPPPTPSDDGKVVDESNEDSPENEDVMENEDSFFWSVAYELVGHLQLKFPDIDPNRLCDLLRLVGLDADKAHAVIKATLERESIGTAQVCRHYLQGECRRADCMFLHDTENITCRFWLRGSCLQDENCVFAHDFTEYYALDDAALAARDYDSEDEGEDAATQLDFEAEDMFPSLQSSAASSTPTTPAGNVSMNFARAVSVQPPPVNHTAGYGLFGGSLLSRAPEVPGVPAPTSRPLYRRTSIGPGTKWVSTGASVTSQYLEFREQAYQMACARNKCFMGATQAYRNGNKSLAKSLSNQGHDFNAKMKEFHYMAASEIFEARNPPNQIYMDRMLDLHGLHVAEAVELLANMLPKLGDEGLDSIYIVTGTGHHSKTNGNARLLPAVEQFLTAEGYRYNGVADGRGFVGMLMVDLQW